MGDASVGPWIPVEEVFREGKKYRQLGRQRFEVRRPLSTQPQYMVKEEEMGCWGTRRSRVYAFVVGDKKPGIGTQRVGQGIEGHTGQDRCEWR